MLNLRSILTAIVGLVVLVALAITGTATFAAGPTPTPAPKAPTTGHPGPRAIGPSGNTDTSSFTIQNIDTTQGTVLVDFYDGSGNKIEPNPLNGGQANPIPLNPGQSFEVVTAQVPNLTPGQYSVVLSAGMKIGAIANILSTGSINFNESYSGLTQGATTFYMPAIVFNYYGWYSLISVQNVGSGTTNVTVSIKCLDGTIGTLQKTGLAQNASVHFDLLAQTPTGFSSGTSCNGSATITSSAQPVVAVDNQRVPTGGNMQSYSGVPSGATSYYVPALYNSYYGWNSSLNILKIGAGNQHVVVTFSDSGSTSCDLTDAVPSCLLYMPSKHPAAGYFGATITSNSLPIVAVVNAANGSQAQTYNAVPTSGATNASGIPAVMKAYYGWNTSVTCQNVGAVATTFHVAYDGYAGNAYNTAQTFSQGQTKEFYTPGESFLPNGYRGGMTVSGNAAGSLISCIVNFNNPGQMASTNGSWSMSTNAFSK
ncbi:MAG: hypothetical protein M1132_05140 [Chloroflexi bacterium]|nr:hypothetical protein [Chloroflexota bacterium]